MARLTPAQFMAMYGATGDGHALVDLSKLPRQTAGIRHAWRVVDPMDLWAMSQWPPGNHEARVARWVAQEAAWRAQVREAVRKAMKLPPIPTFTKGAPHVAIHP